MAQNVKSLSEQFNAKPSEIRCLFRGQLDPLRTRELQEQMLAAGLPQGKIIFPISSLN